MKLLNALVFLAAFGFANVACAQTQPPQTATPSPSMNAKWVSAIVGMKVESPTGARLGIVKDVVVDGYGRASYAVISYAGMMGLGNKYTAVPWATVAEMLQSNRLIMDQAQLENAPILASARPDAANPSWRRTADSYWRGKVAMGPAAPAAGP